LQLATSFVLVSNAEDINHKDPEDLTSTSRQRIADSL